MSGRLVAAFERSIPRSVTIPVRCVVRTSEPEIIETSRRPLTPELANIHR